MPQYASGGNYRINSSSAGQSIRKVGRLNRPRLAIWQSFEASRALNSVRGGPASATCRRRAREMPLEPASQLSAFRALDAAGAALLNRECRIALELAYHETSEQSN